MAVKLVTTGTGSVGDIATGWSVQELRTPFDISNTDGGTGGVNITAKAHADSIYFTNNSGIFTHDKITGLISGTVDDITLQGSQAQFTLAPFAALLDTDRTAPAQIALPLYQIVGNYLSLVTSVFTVGATPSIPLTPVTIQSWTGNVWDHIKQLCAAYEFRLIFSGNNVVLTAIGDTVNALTLDNTTPVQTNLNSQATGNFVEITYQNPVNVPAISTVQTNYALNPSLETNTTNWTQGTAGTYGRIGDHAYGAGNSALSVVTTSNTLTRASLEYNDSSSVGLTPAGLYTRLSYKMYGSMPTFVSIQIETRYTSVSTPFAYNVVNIPNNSPGYSVPDTNWHNVNIPYLARPSDATNVRVQITVTYRGASTGFPTGFGLAVDGLVLSDSPINNFFDGNTVNGVWIGTANNSASTIPSALDTNIIYDAYKDNNNTLSVSAGETTVTTVTGNFFPVTINQPLMTNVWPVNAGYFYMADNNNAAIVPQEFYDLGGSLTVAIGDTPGTLTFTLVGPSSDPAGHTGPYTLAATDGTNQFAQLKVTGTGVVTTPTVLRMGTGADPSTTSVDVAASVDSPFIDTYQRAMSRGIWATQRAAGPHLTIQFSISTTDIAAFGYTTGTIFKYNNANYIVTDVRFGASRADIQAELYTKAGEKDAVWVGKTAGQKDTFWANYTAADEMVTPLRNS